MKENNKMQTEQEIIENFQKLYYYKGTTWQNTSWMGVKVQKYPTDLHIYQEIIYEVRPDVIIETGTAEGGSAYYMAHLCDILGNGKIITIDIETNNKRPFHPRIKYIQGSSIDLEIIKLVEDSINDNMKKLVILDSDHTQNHVRQELALYSKFVTKNSYLIVEDGIVNHPVLPEYGPGPYVAIEEFMTDNTDFIMDKSREKFMLSQNPNGYLKKL